jgi:hypothetical protein
VKLTIYRIPRRPDPLLPEEWLPWFIDREDDEGFAEAAVGSYATWAEALDAAFANLRRAAQATR